MKKKAHYEENRILSLVAAQPGWRVVLPNLGRPCFEDVGAWALIESRIVDEGTYGPWERYEGLVPMVNMGNGGLNICDSPLILSPSDSMDSEVVAANVEEARKQGEADEKRRMRDSEAP